jgi:sugar phosphate isomerase/epimerase
MNRREFITTGLAAAGATGLANVAPAAAKAAKTAAKNIRFALAAYSVREALTKTDYNLFKFIDWCAEMNLDGAELTSYYFKKDFDSAYLRQLRNHAFHTGVTISGTAIRNDFCKPAGPERDQQIDAVKKWIDYAADLWAPHVRIFAGNAPAGVNKEEVLQWVADSVKAVLDHAEQRGVVLGLENHGGITALPEDLLAICRLVGKHPYFGINLDTGNFRRNPYQDLELVAPLAVNVQIKVEVYSGEKKVLADLARLRDIVLAANYKGWVALEYEASGDPFKECPMYLKKLEKLFGRSV